MTKSLLGLWINFSVIAGMLVGILTNPRGFFSHPSVPFYYILLTLLGTSPVLLLILGYPRWKKHRLDSKGQTVIPLSPFALAFALGVSTYVLTMVADVMRGGTGEGSIVLAVVVGILSFVMMILLMGVIKSRREEI